MPSLPIPPELQPLVTALVVPLAFIGWVITYVRALRKPAPAAALDLKAVAMALNDTLVIERGAREIAAAIHGLTGEVSRLREEVREERLGRPRRE